MLKNGYLWHRPELKNSCRIFKSISETTKSVRVTFLKNDAKFVKNESKHANNDSDRTRLTIIVTIHLRLLRLWTCFQSTRILAVESMKGWNRAKPKYHNIIATCEHRLCMDMSVQEFLLIRFLLLSICMKDHLLYEVL